MKIIHCADLHFDSKIDRLPAEKSKTIREEVFATFEKMCEYALDCGVRLILISGDMFDTPNVSKKLRLKLINLISACSSIDFLYLSGNHDEGENLFKEGSLPSNFKFFGNDWSAYDYGNIAVSGINLSAKNGMFFYDELNLLPEKTNIVMLHGQISNYNVKDGSEIISIAKLKNKNIDYLALGHIHSYSCGNIDERGVYAYCGCLAPRGFDELDKKGFVLLDVNNGKVEHKFIPFAERSFYEYTFDITDKNNFYTCVDDILSDLKNSFNDNSLIKVVLVGEHSVEFEIDAEYLTKKINDEFFYGKVYDKTTLNVVIADFENDKSICGEFARLVLSSNLDEDIKKQVLMVGLKAFNEGE